MRRMTTAVLVAVVVLGLAACGDDDGEGVREIGGSESSASGSGSGSASAPAAACAPVGNPAEADRNVAVELDEWSVTADPDAATSGRILFAANNVGSEVHELVIVRGDSPEELPLDEDEAVDEEALPEGGFIGEIEGFPAGDLCNGVFDLDPGSYVLFCNIVEEEDGEVENHFQLGMHTTFSVGE